MNFPLMDVKYEPISELLNCVYLRKTSHFYTFLENMPMIMLMQIYIYAYLSSHVSFLIQTFILTANKQNCHLSVELRNCIYVIMRRKKQYNWKFCVHFSIYCANQQV